MNYFDELRKQKDKDEDFYKYLENYSDYTYLCFKKFVLEELPKLFLSCFKKGGSVVSFKFKVPSQVKVDIAQDIYYENGDKKTLLVCDFLKYIKSIPGLFFSQPEYNIYEFQGKLEDLIKYYYEELQSEEYFDKSR